MGESKKINIGILFGGKSAEHEISLMSAKSIHNALDKDKYDVTLIGITKTGAWLPISQSIFLHDTGGNKKQIKDTQEEDISISITPAHSSFLIPKNNQKKHFDVVFPVLHGPYGEDGSVQGLLKLANVPFVGASVLGSALGMDKDVMKRLLRDAGLPTARFIALCHHDNVPNFKKVQEVLSDVVFVKPANLGSSVGVSRVSNEGEYSDALREAFTYDDKIIIEENIVGREIEIAIIGNNNPIASVPGEVVTDKSHHSFYSYEAKYIDEKGAELLIPAELSEEATKNVQQIAVKVFQILCCEGMARVDFFLKDDGTFVVNEINTIPGFTSISMYPRLWEASGLSYSELLDRLVDLALDKFKRSQNY